MLKKAMSLFLAVCISAGLLSACGNSAESSSETTKPSEAVTEKATEAATDEGTTDEGTTDEGTTDEGTTDEVENDPFPGADLGGVTINLQMGGGFDPDRADEVNVERWAAQKEMVEEKFNITLNLNPMDGISWEDTTSTLISAVAAGDSIVDTGDLSRYFMSDLVVNGALVDVTDVLENYPIPKAYWKQGSEYAGRAYGAALAKNRVPAALVYNRDLIKAAGMEKTPGEMFKEGKWSYDDFYNYLKELGSKLPEGVDAFGIHALHWARFSTHTNGTSLYHPTTYIPTFTNNNVYDAIDIFTKLVTEGIARNATEVIRDDGTTGYDWNSVGNGFAEGELAMTHGSDWSFQDWQSRFDMGIVPMPWGPNTTIQNNDYTTLTNYHAVYHDCGFWPVFVGSDRKATPEQLYNILYSYRDDVAVTMLADYEKEQNGEPITDPDAGLPRNFTTELDIELWDWWRSTTEFEPADTVSPSNTLNRAIYEISATNKSARSVFESIIGKEISDLLAANLIDPANLTEELIEEAEEYDASVESAE